LQPLNIPLSVDKIIADWKKKSFKTIYWFEGEEEYFINKLVDFAEHEILPESERSFNLTIFYGKEAEWPSVLNTCRRYPMFADRQLVILKEAQHMRDLDKLEPYFQHPLSSTILIVAYKDKKLDARTKMSRWIREHGEILHLKKIYDNQLPEWTLDLIRAKGFAISQNALLLLVDHIGNDLSRINNEIDKVLLNLGSRKNITEDDIESYVGVSKEYNFFALQSALARKDLSHALLIIQYFGNNPKAAPMPLLLASLYSFFSKVYLLFGQSGPEESGGSDLGEARGQPMGLRDQWIAARNYGLPGIEAVILLLHEYNLRSVGINSQGISESSLLKEMVAKMLA
jgi:DNA polymerase-3 subunit delta